MCRKRGSIVLGELAGIRIDNFEALIVDLIAMNHPNIFSSSPEPDPRSLQALLECGASRNGAAVRQLLGSGHPGAVFLDLSGKTISCVRQGPQAGAAAMKIDFGADCVVKKGLIDSG